MAKSSVLSFPGIPWDEFATLRAEDLPGPNVVKLILEDQPILANGVVNHQDEPSLIIAHRDKYLVQEARAFVNGLRRADSAIRFRSFSCQDALIWGRTMCSRPSDIDKGDVGCGVRPIQWSRGVSSALGAALYRKQRHDRRARRRGRSHRVGLMQCPYYVHPAVIYATGLPEAEPS